MSTCVTLMHISLNAYIPNLKLKYQRFNTYVNASGHSTSTISTYYYNRKYNSWKAILDADYMKATVFPIGMTIIIHHSGPPAV